MSIEAEMKLLKLIEEYRDKAREKKSDDAQTQFFEAYAAGISRAIYEMKKQEGKNGEIL